MASIKLKGDTSGEITISAPAVAGTTTLELPATSSTLATQNALGVRNLIINGDMRIAQRGTSATTYSLSAGGFRFDDVDRFCVNAGNVATGQVSSEQISSTGLDGFPTAKRITVTTAEASPATNGYMGFVTALEAQMLQHLKWGTSNAETLTLSFWVRSSVTGTFGGNIIGTDSRPSENRAYPYNYTISSANTWEKKTVTITGDVAGTMNNDNGQGFELDWYLYLGSDYQNGTENTWNSNPSSDSYHDNTAKTNLLATSGATFDITGVQLEVGDTATPFEHRPYDMELARCQRYYEKSYNISTSPGTLTDNVVGGVGEAVSTTKIASSVHYKVSKRISGNTVTIYAYDGTSGTVTLHDSAGNSGATGAVPNKIGEFGYEGIKKTGGTNFTVGNYYWWQWTSSAEL